MRLLIVAALLGLASPARADTEKSPYVSTGLAVGATFAGWGLIYGGYQLELHDQTTPGDVVFIAGVAVSAVGPSAGHFYLGNWKHALVLSGIRGVALTAATTAGLAITACSLAGGIGPVGSSMTGCDVISAHDWLWSGLWVAGAFGLYDWVDSFLATDRRNRALVVPTGRGLALVGRF